jgi:hypothetical protein
MDLLFRAQLSHPQDWARLPLKQSASALRQRSPESGFDPQSLLDCREGSNEPLGCGRPNKFRERVPAASHDFHKRRSAHFRRPPSKL